ncbi:ribosomal RNA small subunit methyltransferase A [Patescibacteria group bacterium]|nr:ribosomal RNA small subunit methyltransferase A [Patescibacteria group bacterium]
MDLLKQTKFLIKKTGLKPDKLKGQNFCIEQKVIEEMIKAANISPQDTIIEVGPGFGFLTDKLCNKTKEVIAVELDKKLFKIVKNLEKFYNNLQAIEGDILKLKMENLLSRKRTVEKFQNYKIVANLPYAISSVFLKKFLTSDFKPQAMTLLLQKEVAQRICAAPGKMSLLALSIQLYSKPVLIKIISKESFWPVPQVDSAILRIEKIHAFPFAKEVPEKVFWQVIRSGFCSKRKQLHNNLKNSLHLNTDQLDKVFSQSQLNEKIRAQELSLKDWLKLAKSYNRLC